MLIWVVILTSFSRKNTVVDTLYVRANTCETAISIAKKNSVYFRSRKCTGIAHEADPQGDLGAKSKCQVLKMYKDIRKAVMDKDRKDAA